MLHRKNKKDAFYSNVFICVIHSVLLIFIVHSIPVTIVLFLCCKIVLEFVPASYAINRLCKCLCGHVPTASWLYFQVLGEVWQ
jgi:hypothetical protein